MKKIYLILFVCISIVSVMPVNGAAHISGLRDDQQPAQTPAPAPRHDGRPVTESVFTGDIFVNVAATEDQQRSDVVVATYGYIYSIMSFRDGANGGFRISVSKDHGLSFQELHFETYSTYYYYDMKINVIGTDSATAKLLVSGVLGWTANHNAFLLSFDSNTGALVDNWVIEAAGTDSVYAVDMATDWYQPSWISSPFSMVMAYSKFGAPQDSIITNVTTNGGTTFTRQGVAGTTRYFGALSVAYGISSSASNGRYFLVAHEHDYLTLNGNVNFYYTGYDVSDLFYYTSQIDTMAASTAGKARNPVIKMEYDYANNDSNGLSAMVVFESDFNGLGDIDIIGYRNFDPRYVQSWSYNQVDYTNAHTFQPSLNWDPFYNNFLCTYWDSTNNALVYRVANYNFPSTGGANWYTIMTGYNDVPSVGGGTLQAPWPRVAINPLYHQAVFTWVSTDAFGGLVLFDREFSPVSVEENAITSYHKAYPNPADKDLTIEIGMKNADKTSVQVFDIAGNRISQIENSVDASGIYRYHINTSALPAGMYTYRLTGSSETTIGKFVVTHQ